MESAYVTHITAQTDMKQRLTDLGLIPGTRVTCTARSPSGDPRAYLIRGTLIALRRADADHIWLERREAVPT
jgi:ferrous iron transport protein A